MLEKGGKITLTSTLPARQSTGSCLHAGKAVSLLLAEHVKLPRNLGRPAPAPKAWRIPGEL